MDSLFGRNKEKEKQKIELL